VARHAAYPLVLTARMVASGTGWRPMRLLRRLCELSRAEPHVWQGFRDRQLRAALAHALQHIPAYKPLAERLLPVVQEDPMAALREFPVLRKRDLQEREEEMLSEVVPAGGRVPGYTSGSTGEPTKYWVDKRRCMFRSLVAFRDKMYTGWRPGEPGALIEVPSAFFWNASRFRRAVNRLGGSYIGLNVHEMTPASTRAFLERMERQQPFHIRGITSGIDEYARFIEAQGLTARARALRVQAVITTCEKLYPTQRQRIERVFGTRVFDLYGCNEMGVMATECRAHRGRHVAADTLVLEVLDEAGQPVPPGAMGRLVLTDPWNLGFALIRLDLGDMGRYLPEDGPCPCGVTFPRIAPVEGRVIEFLTLPDGRRVHGLHLAGHLNTSASVRHYRIEQGASGDVVVYIVGDPDAEDPQLDRLRDSVPEGMALRLEYCSELSRTARGKRLLVVSRAADGGPNGGAG
jgi:phenylacetate-CoA ligase